MKELLFFKLIQLLPFDTQINHLIGFYVNLHFLEGRTMRIGILTGGGDCPGLNAVIRAITRKGLQEGDNILGILHGWKGMITGQHEELTQRSVSGLIHRGGTILHTSRTNPFKEEGGGRKGDSYLQTPGFGRPGRHWW